MQVPFFVPTSAGPLDAMAHLPDGGQLRSPAVVFLPGGENPRTRNRVGLQLARDLAATGQPVLRLDLPGCGLSPIPDVMTDRDVLASTLVEAVAWFRDATGSSSSAIAGTCGGAATALAVAARDPGTEAAIAIDLPTIRRRKRKTLRRVRAGIAAVDPVGERFTTLLAGGGSKGDDMGWFPGVLDSLRRADDDTQITFVYGEDDHFYEDFKLLQNSDELPREVIDRWNVEVRSGRQLYGFTKVEDMQWLTQRLVARLTSGTGSSADD